MSHSCLANGRTDGGHGGLWKTIFIQKLKELGMSRVITHGFPRALFDCSGAARSCSARPAGPLQTPLSRCEAPQDRWPGRAVHRES